MNKRIAIPTSNGLLDEHFGHCRWFTVVELVDDTIKTVTLLDAPPHQPGYLPRWLAERNITDVIAGGMGRKAIQLFNQQNINVYVGAPSLSPKNLIEGFLNETLAFSENCCDH
jgi:predicted Fe-Mo cluster-binding NifX family protein